jgi:hypothetical protein
MMLHHTSSLVDAEPDVAITTPILSAIGQLHRLQVLDIVDVTDGEQGVPPLTAFSALTASSQLQRLHVDGYKHDTLPRGAAKYVLPSGQQLRQLTYLDITHSGFGFYPSSWRLTSKDLRRIAVSCAGLQSLSIQGLLKPGADNTSALLLLTECRSLSVGGRAFDNRAAAVVGQMTQLTSLSWWCSQGFDSSEVQQLTALKALQKLKFVPVVQRVPALLWETLTYSYCADVPQGYDLRPASEMEPDLLALFGLGTADDHHDGVWVATSSDTMVGG